jgi:hypothetical protein
VRDRTGRIVASIAVTHSYSTQPAALLAGTSDVPAQDVILASLDRAARELSRRLGWES